MPLLEVQNPFTGAIEEVNFSGDEPTQDEINSVYSLFQQEAVKKTGGTTKLDLATASTDEIREYIRQKKQLGVDPVSGEKVSEEPIGDLRDPDVDYTSGLQNLVIRTGFSNRELPSEKASYLTDAVGADGFRQDKGGRFILTKKGRERLNLGDGPELAIDEEGFSRYDIADFAGESGIPLITGIVAGVLTGGLGTIPAMAVVGGSMGLAKIVDETMEYAAGDQRQTKAQIAKDAAFEGAMGFLGEGIGRGISTMIGRFMKGSSAEAVETGKELGRRLIERGYRPTVEGAAPGAFSILGRAQAIYEGVIPNRKAALANLNTFKDELKALGATDEVSLDGLVSIMKKDIDNIYSTPNEKVREARRVLEKDIEQEIEKIMKPLKETDSLSKDLVESLKNARDSFQTQADGLFKSATDLLASGNRIIPVSGLKSLMDDLADTQMIDGVSSLLNQRKPIGRILKNAREAAIAKLKQEGKDATDEFLIAKNLRVTPAQAQVIRSTISDLSFNPQFVNNAGQKALNDLSKEIDQAFIDGEGLLVETIDNINLTRQAPVGDELLASNDPDLLKEGLKQLREAKKYYGTGINRFKDLLLTRFVRQVGEGEQGLDYTKVLDKVVKPNNPQDLIKFLKATKKARTIKGVRPEEVKVRFAEKDYSIEAAERLLAEFTERGTEASVLRQGIKLAKDQRDRAADIARTAATGEEETRQKLAGAFFTRLLDDNTFKRQVDGVQFIDGIQVGRAIDKLGSTKKVLFKNELKEIEELATILRSTGVELNKGILDEFADRPIVQTMRGLIQATKNEKAVDKDSLLQAFSTGSGEDIMNKLFAKKAENSSLIDQFMNNSIKIGDETFQLPNHAAVKEQVQNAAMGRLLRSLGDVTKPQFSEDFLSGRLGDKFYKTLSEDYGEKTITAMFGKEQSDYLFELADVMKRVSQRPLKGLGGLAPATIALGLTTFAFMANPIATGSALAFYTGMSSVLRSKAALKLLTTTREPGADLISTVARDIQTAVQKTNLQIATSPEGPFKLTPETKQTVQQAASSLRSAVPNVMPPTAGTAARVDPTNPIVNPDPATQALAQRLAGTSAISPRLPN